MYSGKGKSLEADFKVNDLDNPASLRRESLWSLMDITGFARPRPDPGYAGCVGMSGGVQRPEGWTLMRGVSASEEETSHL